MSQLPANITTVPVRGKFIGSDGVPVSGNVLFTPKPVRLVDAAVLTVIVGRTVTMTLDEDGAGEIQLAATDDPDVVPFEWTYAVSEGFEGGATYEIEVPIAQAASGIELATVAPVPGSTGTGGLELSTAALQSYVDDAEASALSADTSEAAALAAQTAAQAAANAVAGVTGNGFPEGVVTAPVGTSYVDLSATNGAIRWIKASGTGNTGWKVVYGDTGFRRNDPAASWFLNGATPGADADVGTRFRRIGSRVQLMVCVTTPAGWTNGSKFLTIPSGFRPTGIRYLHGGYVNSYAVTAATDVSGLEFWSGVIANARYLYTWFTDDQWPATLPGIAI